MSLASKIVPLGYNTYVEIDDQSIFCTSASITLNSKSITSNGSYYGVSNQMSANQMTMLSGQIGIGNPLRLDTPDFSVNISFEILKSQLSKLKNMINNRLDTHKIVLYTLKSDVNSGLIFDDAYWTSISLSASQGALLTCSISFFILKNYNELRNLQSPNSKELEEGGQKPPTSGMYGASAQTKQVIPYYATSAQINNNCEGVIGWSLDIQQQITPKLTCMGNKQSSIPPLPSHLMFGFLTFNTKVTKIVFDKTPLFAHTGSTALETTLGVGQSTSWIGFQKKSLYQNSTISIYAGGNSVFLTLGFNILESVTPNITDSGSMYSVQYSYKSHLIIE